MHKSYTHIFLEAIVIGIVFIILGKLIGCLSKPFFGVSLPEICSKWNQNYILEINLFLLGFISHLCFEFSGMSHWYCTQSGY